MRTEFAPMATSCATSTGSSCPHEPKLRPRSPIFWPLGLTSWPSTHRRRGGSSSVVIAYLTGYVEKPAVTGTTHGIDRMHPLRLQVLVPRPQAKRVRPQPVFLVELVV